MQYLSLYTSLMQQFAIGQIPVMILPEVLTHVYACHMHAILQFNVPCFAVVPTP